MQTSQISPQQAAQELLNRRAARKSLIAFTEYTNPEYEAVGHHKLIASELEAVERGEIDRLMIFMPPRHGKSELASRRFPSWYLGRNPNKQIIAASYNSDLASDFGREVRDIVKTPEYSRLFDVRLAEDSRAVNRWHTSQKGVYIAAGVGTAITGRGANIALIDDPFKDRQEADSEVTRETVWKWYTSTLRTRLMPGGAIILIQTRWHEDDLAGRLLKQNKDRWKVLELPAIENEDTANESALWPEWYDLKTLREIKNDVGQRDWNALFQQRPTVEEGTYFKREWFQRFNLGEEPQTNNYQSSDYAVTDQGGDYTEFGVWGVDSDNDLWAKDWWYGQKDASVWINAQLQQIKESNTLCSFGETGVIRRAIEPFLKKRATQEKIFTRFEWITRTRDKASMARAFQGMASMGKVHIPNTEWGDRLINQLVAFPAGEYVDAVDVCALIALALSDAHPAIEPPKDTAPQQVDCWGRKFRDNESWKTV